MKYGMTEKKAKEILMYLAKNAGFDDIGFSIVYDDAYLGCVKKSKNYSKGYFVGWVSDHALTMLAYFMNLSQAERATSIF